MAGWQEFTGLNRGYVLELYEQYPARSGVGRSRDACAVRAVDAAGGRGRAPRSRRLRRSQKIVGAVNLAQSIRRYGHLAAQLDPLGSRPPSAIPSLLPETTASPTRICARCRRRWSPAPLGERRSNMRSTSIEALRRALLFDDRLRLLARVRAGGAATGCGRPPRTAASARRPIRSIRSRCSSG